MNTVEQQILKSGRRRRGNVVLRRSGDLLFIGGHGPEDEVTGEPFYIGRLGGALTTEDGYKAARICGEILLSAMQEMCIRDRWNIGTLQGMPEMEGKWATAQGWAGPGGNAVLSYPNTVHILSLIHIWSMMCGSPLPVRQSRDGGRSLSAARGQT